MFSILTGWRCSCFAAGAVVTEETQSAKLWAAGAAGSTCMVRSSSGGRRASILSAMAMSEEMVSESERSEAVQADRRVGEASGAGTKGEEKSMAGAGRMERDEEEEGGGGESRSREW